MTIGSRSQAERIITSVEARAAERFPDRPLKDALRLHLQDATDAAQSYKAASDFLAADEDEEMTKAARRARGDAFYRDDVAGQTLYAKHTRETSGDTRLLQSEVEKLFDSVAATPLVEFVKRITHDADDLTALNVVFANAPQIYELRRAAVNGAVTGRPRSEILDHVASAKDLAERITKIAEAVVKSAASVDPARAIREGASSW